MIMLFKENVQIEKRESKNGAIGIWGFYFSTYFSKTQLPLVLRAHVLTQGQSSAVVLSDFLLSALFVTEQCLVVTVVK